MLIPLTYGSERPEILAEFAELFTSRNPRWKWPFVHTLYANEYAWTVDRLFERLGADLTGKLVMDAGGGASALQHYIARRGADVLNVSHGPGQLPGKTAAGVVIPRVRCHAADLVETGQEPGTFDAIVSVSAIEHNPWPKIERIVAHLLDLLKPGAPLIVTVPAGREGKWYQRGTFPGRPEFPNVYLWDIVALDRLTAAVWPMAHLVSQRGGPGRERFAEDYRAAWDAMMAGRDSTPGAQRMPYLSAGFVFEQRA